MNQPIRFANWREHGAPWRNVGEEVSFTHEDAGQGSHPPHPLVATLGVRRSDGEFFDVILGREEHIDKLIQSLQIVKARMQVEVKRQEFDSANSRLASLEKATQPK